MIYDIRHVTTYRYDAAVSAARCTLRLVPASGEGQRLLGCGIDVAPRPAALVERIDFFGTRVATAVFGTPHRELRIVATSQVAVERPPPPVSTPSWEQVRLEAFAAPGLGPHAPAHFLYPSRLVPLYAPATAYAAASFTPGRSIVDAAGELMRRVRDEFRYDPRATAVSTPLAEAFDSRSGVCQDFAHATIAALRGLGLPAAYVSGYIRTLPPPGKARLAGADASHAWVSVWCGGSCGWIDFDPTNAVLVGDDHIVIGRGRDYADVSPLDGVILASGGQTLSVNVDVSPAMPARGLEPAVLDVC